MLLHALTWSMHSKIDMVNALQRSGDLSHNIGHKCPPTGWTIDCGLWTKTERRKKIDNLSSAGTTEERDIERAILEVCRALSSTLDLDLLFELAADLLGNLIGYYSCIIMLRDSKTQEFKAALVQNMERERKLEFEKSISSDIVKRIMNRGQPMLITDVKKEGLALSPDSECILILPFFFEGKLLGFLFLDGLERERFSHLSMGPFSLLTNQIAIAIKNARLYENLYETSRSLNSSLDLEEISGKTLDFIQTTMSASVSYMMLLNDQTRELELKASRGIEGVKKGEIRLKLGEGVAGKVVEDGKSLLIPDLSEDSSFSHFELKGKAEVRSLFSVPMVAHNKVIGALSIGESLPQPFPKEAQRLLSILASLSASSLENANLVINDGLTEIYNHRYFQERLSQEIKKIDRYHGFLSLIMIDIDHFKHFNDTYGHTQGDLILKELAYLLKGNFRETDLVARYGGEEFVVVLPATDLKGAYLAAERGRKLVEKHRFKSLKGKRTLALTISSGVASYPSCADSKEKLIREADEALYRAKSSGRNKVCQGEEKNSQ